MKQQMPPGIPLAIVILATMTMVALRAAGGRPAATAGPPDLARREMVTPPRSPDGGPGSSVEQMQSVFHELHADGRHALCAVCDR
jgi:hypothetical protein